MNKSTTLNPFTKLKKTSVALWFLWACSLSNVVAALVIFFVGSAGFLLLGLKDVLLFFFMALVVCSFRISQKIMLGLTALGLVSAMFLLISLALETIPIAALAGLRQAITVFLIFFLGALLCPNDQERYSSLVNTTLTLGLFIATTGLIERFLYIWPHFISPYFELKSIGVLSNGYPFVFIEPTSFFNEFSGVTGVLRLTSVFLDPVNLGHAMVFFAYLSHITKRKYLGGLFALCVILSFSKAAILQLLIMYFLTSKLPLVLKAFAIFCVTTIGFFLVANHAGFDSHSRGLLNSLESLSFFGAGLGSAGNVASMYAINTSGIGDSFAGAILGQIGIIGTAIWIAGITWCAFIAGQKNHVLATLFVVQIALSILSENSFNFLSILLIAFFAGMTSQLPSSSPFAKIFSREKLENA